MLARITCLLTLTAPLFAADPPADARDKGGPAELQGMWKLVSVEVNGEATEPLAGQPRWVIRGERVLYGGQELARLTVDAAATPKVIDLSFASPERVLEGIYAVEQDTLKICVNGQVEGVRERPQTFSTKDQDKWRLLVFQRVKAGEGDALEGLSGFVGLALSFNQDRGEVSVADVIGDSPAKKAGLRKGDVVLKVGGEGVADLQAAVGAVRRAKPGSQLVLHIRRDGKEEDVMVKVGLLPFTVLMQLD
jgi:uncharacterized protein (TIGR03067 family)